VRVGKPEKNKKSTSVAQGRGAPMSAPTLAPLVSYYKSGLAQNRNDPSDLQMDNGCVGGATGGLSPREGSALPSRTGAFNEKNTNSSGMSRVL